MKRMIIKEKITSGISIGDGGNFVFDWTTDNSDTNKRHEIDIIQYL
jgi:ribose 5-phosphate isomerase